MNDYLLFAGYNQDNTAAIFRDKDDNFTEIAVGDITNSDELKLYRYYQEKKEGSNYSYQAMN